MRIRPGPSLLLALAALVPPGAAAQTVVEADQRVRCDSVDGRWTHCALPFAGEAVLLRQLSRNACIENQSWGRDPQGLWVAAGCRGEFGPKRQQTRREDDATVAKRLRCESRGLYRHCPVDVSGGVRLVRQLSGRDCELGESWGYDDHGVWVHRGCRAEFEVRGEPRPSSRLFSRLFGRKRAGEDGSRAIRCESRDGKPGECRVADIARVEILQQISSAPCVEGRSWGWEAQRIWVDGGCRAQFRVWQAGQEPEQESP
ncbi:DUF3011 domain-containing protein [Luteimonas sp. e5]